MIRFMPGNCCVEPCFFPDTFCYETSEDDPWDLTGEMSYFTSKPSYLPEADIFTYGWGTPQSMPYTLFWNQQFNSGFWGLGATSGWYSCMKRQMKCDYDSTWIWTNGFGIYANTRYVGTDQWYYFFYMPDGYAASSNPDHMMIPYQGISMTQMIRRQCTITIDPLVPWGSVQTVSANIWLWGGYLYWGLPALTYDYSWEYGFEKCGWTDCSVHPEPLLRGNSHVWLTNYMAQKVCPTIDNGVIMWQGTVPWNFSGNAPYNYRGDTSDPTCSDKFQIDLYDCSGISDGIYNMPTACSGGGVVSGRADVYQSVVVAGKPQTPIVGTGGIVLRSEGATAIVEAIGTGSTSIVGTGGILTGNIPAMVEITNYKINNIVSVGGFGASGLSAVEVRQEEDA